MEILFAYLCNLDPQQDHKNMTNMVPNEYILLRICINQYKNLESVKKGKPLLFDHAKQDGLGLGH